MAKGVRDLINRRTTAHHTVATGRIDTTNRIGNDPIGCTITIRRTHPTGTMGVDDAIRVVVDAVTGLGRWLAGKQDRLYGRIPNMVHRTAVIGGRRIEGFLHRRIRPIGLTATNPQEHSDAYAEDCGKALSF
jgi:hypothetical protein